ncbi:hypothetical protein DRO60_01980 [Candidatus Bathyarchaeota archaeon]|nr:MAG: hypothetical protein DRO60_01980 [Candidatus Bathyarchaeota archaeon]
MNLRGAHGRRGRKAQATLALAGATMLGALSVAVDYSMEFSGLKDLMSSPWAMAFPFLSFLKFDFDGVPIFCSTALFGLTAGFLASVIMGLAIAIRASGLIGLVGAAMKALAEASTMVGAYLALVKARRARGLWLSLGPITRAAVMCLANLFVVPHLFQQPLAFVVGLMPLIAFFNIIQGSITTYLGMAVALAVVKRAPHLLPEDAPILRSTRVPA